MTDQQPQSEPLQSQPESHRAGPRTLVNGSTTGPYVPSKAVPVRRGGDDNKLHTTKGQPT